MYYIYAIEHTDRITRAQLVAWFAEMRRISVTADGVYDLALYENVSEGVPRKLWCILDLDDEIAFEKLSRDRTYRQILKRGEQLGIKLHKQDGLMRVV